MTEPAPQPSQVSPVAGGHLRASDGDRDQVATLLSTAYAEGRLTREEHEERLDQLVRAKTFDDLVGLTHDLVIAGSASTPGQAAPPSTSPAEDPWAVHRMIAVFSGSQRKGRWRVPRQLETYAVFGGVDLDLREAVFESPVVEVNGIWCFGGLDVKVPEGVEVRNEVIGIFGGCDVKNVGDPQPGAPVLVLKGVALFGGVSVKGPKRKRAATALDTGRHGLRGWHRH